MKQYGIKQVAQQGSVKFSIPVESLEKAEEGAAFLNAYSNKAVYTVVVREVSGWEEV